jgi:GMP synthase (glutamine-hydrolysing)
MVLFIKHIAIEGPETIGRFFDRNGLRCRTIDLSLGDPLPKDLSDCEAVVCLGGPMNIYEEARFPFLREENRFIQEVIKRHTPFLGLCLGSQLLAKASGAQVTKSPVKEIGWSTVHLTAEGKKDPLFRGLGEQMDIFQWHEDMFQVPKEGKLLATSLGCPHQALKVGPIAYGLQFHVEITDQSIREWSDNYFRKDDVAFLAKKQEMLAEYAIRRDKYNQMAERIYNNFLALIHSFSGERMAAKK